MTTHDKTAFCKVCRSLGSLKRKWYKSPCRDCQSWGSSWLYFLIFSLMVQIEDDKQTLQHLSNKINSMLRWLHKDLKPRLEETTALDLDEVFMKVLMMQPRK